jgi:hypothetical protein
VLNGYEHVVFSNNDIEVPGGALAMLHTALEGRDVTVVAPLTSRRGAGHNPAQDVLHAHRTDLQGLAGPLPAPVDGSSLLDEYVQNPSHCQAIQNALTEKFERRVRNYIEVRDKKTSSGGPEAAETQAEAEKTVMSSQLPVSSWKGRVKFNGFLFGINLLNTQAAAFNHRRLLLLDPGLVMVGQEDSLTTRILALHLPPPRICLHAFVHHTKSATVQASGYDVAKGSNQVETRNNLQLYHRDLDNTSSAASGGKVDDGMSVGVGPSGEPPLSRYFSCTRVQPTLATCPDNSPGGLFLRRLYAPFPALASACVNLSGAPPGLNATSRSSCSSSDPPVVTIAMAISDPATTPTAGDMFTAQELALNLQLLFRVRVLFLHRGVNWYDMRGVDVLLTFLDAFDLSRLQHAAPHLVRVAWMRNWFHRWQSRPWLGNYDLLLVSSGVAQRYFQQFVNVHGGSLVHCHRRCPAAFSEASSLHPRVKRVVPVAVLRIATNPLRFAPPSSKHAPPATPLFASPDPAGSTSTASTNTNSNSSTCRNSGPDSPRVDYVFTGNYWGHTRDIMQHLQPGAAALAPYRGWLVGSGLRAALESGLLAPEAEDMLRPPVPYERLPEVYAATKIVLDDNNHVTKAWGSVNSRVFDALAAGALVISNGEYMGCFVCYVVTIVFCVADIIGISIYWAWQCSVRNCWERGHLRVATPNLLDQRKQPLECHQRFDIDPRAVPGAHNA